MKTRIEKEEVLVDCPRRYEDPKKCEECPFAGEEECVYSVYEIEYEEHETNHRPNIGGALVPNDYIWRFNCPSCGAEKEIKYILGISALSSMTYEVKECSVCGLKLCLISKDIETGKHKFITRIGKQN